MRIIKKGENKKNLNEALFSNYKPNKLSISFSECMISFLKEREKEFYLLANYIRETKDE